MCLIWCIQAVEAEDSHAGDGELDGGMLRKRQRANAQEQQSDADAADLQQVCPLQLLQLCWRTVTSMCTTGP